IRSYPNSVCRFTVAFASSTVSSAACEIIGRGGAGAGGPPRAARAGGGGGRVGRLWAEENEVRALPLERRRQDASGGEEVGAGGRVVADEHGAVGTHRERLAKRVGRARRAERDHHYFGVGIRLLHP